MPVTYLIWDAPLSSTHLAPAHTDSTLLHTSMMLAPPVEDDKEEREKKRTKGGQEYGMLFPHLKTQLFDLLQKIYLQQQQITTLG